ncbi:MAG: allantoinase AllB [Gemmatimonadaceae bacterium]
MDRVIRAQRVVTPDGVRPASIHIDRGRIARVAAWDDVPTDVEVIDAGNNIVMPGVIDTHVHVNEPGRAEWEGFDCATHAAAAGGVTTILDMPLNSIPATTTVGALEAKRKAASGKTVVNVEYIGGVIPGNSGELEGLRDAGVRAFKCFLSPSGVEEFPAVSENDLREAFPILERLGLPLMVHAEDPSLLRPGPPGGSRHYADWLASRPVEAERSAIEMLVRLMKPWPARVHIVHLSSAKSLDVVRGAKAAELPITVETCPHYLTFAAEEIPDGATEYKCAPPIRSAAEREALWSALIAGDIDLVASDHSPCPPILKEPDSDFFAAWGGIASLQISLSAVWTGARARGVPIEKVAKWMSASTARLAGFENRKGALVQGYDADIVIFDDDARFTVDPVALEHRHAVTPYAGRELFGRVINTLVGGRAVFG